MAQQLKKDMSEKVIPVDRSKLHKQLLDNKVKHVADYNEAMQTYKEVLLQRIESSFKDARYNLDKAYDKIRSTTISLKDENIGKQSEVVVLLERQTLGMPVPRSYESEYDVAIEMVLWDTRDVIELTYSEFVCFVQDKWDWKAGFEEISSMYKAFGTNK